MMEPFEMLKKVSVAFSSGVFGGLVNSLAVWAFGVTNLHTILHVGIAPAWSAQWLYPRLVWGGLWGLLFATSVLRGREFMKGFLLSLAPTAAQLLYFLPYQAHKGFFGLQLGALTPVVVLIFNLLWGLSAVVWLRATGIKE
jgi:hypothetical protein